MSFLFPGNCQLTIVERLYLTIVSISICKIFVVLPNIIELWHLSCTNWLNLTQHTPSDTFRAGRSSKRAIVAPELVHRDWVKESFQVNFFGSCVWNTIVGHWHDLINKEVFTVTRLILVEHETKHSVFTVGCLMYNVHFQVHVLSVNGVLWGCVEMELCWFKRVGTICLESFFESTRGCCDLDCIP